jgi:hypothetical protein
LWRNWYFATHRLKKTTWTEFLKAQWDVLAAADVFTPSDFPSHRSVITDPAEKRPYDDARSRMDHSDF